MGQSRTSVQYADLQPGDVIEVSSSLPFEAETWGTPIEHEPEQMPDVPPDWERP